MKPRLFYRRWQGWCCTWQHPSGGRVSAFGLTPAAALSLFHRHYGHIVWGRA